MRYFISYNIGHDKGAFSKARCDVEEILQQSGFCPIMMKEPNINSKLLKKFKVQYFVSYVNDLGNWKRVCRQLKEGDILFLQHPLSSSAVVLESVKVLRRRKVKVILLIHDIYALRDHQDLRKKYYRIRDVDLPNNCDIVISHNWHMSEALREIGVRDCRYVDLEIFDYLFKKVNTRNFNDSDKYRIIIAGNLAKSKAGYIYDPQWIRGKLSLMLYGANYQMNANAEEKVTYMGNFPPDEVPERLSNGFGLIWDGNKLEGCGGNTGEYLKINNPHKASLYVASGIPLIVWSQSALADFVRQWGVGICVDTLLGLETEIEKLSKQEFEDICRNVQMVSEKIRTGYFFSSALGASLNLD